MQPTFLIGLIGSGIQASLTPTMHMREGDEQGFRYLYRLIDLTQLGLGPEALPELLMAAERMGFNGLNITHPCKQAALSGVTDLSPEAAAIGAVNTVVFTGSGAVGHNTDWSGFARSLRRGLPTAPLDHVVVLGAGGAGAAVSYALGCLETEKVTVLDADEPRAAALVASLAQRFRGSRIEHAPVEELTRLLARADGLVHATPTGMAAHPGIAVPADALRPELWVADVVYRPLETELLRAARKAGCRTLDGGSMAVFQAADALRLFTGFEPDPERMLAHFERLSAQEDDRD